MFARKAVYIPLYCPALKRHAWAECVELAKMAKHEDITLQDFDAYNHRELGYSFEDVLNDQTRKMGHGFVLMFVLDHLIRQ